MDGLFRQAERNEFATRTLHSTANCAELTFRKNTMLLWFGAWHDNKMKCVRDLLVWYNNLDVKPYLLALDSQSDIYKDKGIDMLTRAISLPGLAVLWMFNTIGDRISVKDAFERHKPDTVFSELLH